MIYFSASRGTSSMGLIRSFRKLSIKDVEPSLLSSKFESDDIMVAKKHRRESDSVEAHSNRKASLGKPTHTFRKSIQRQLRKRQACSLKRSGSSIDCENSRHRPKSLSENEGASATTHGNKHKISDSKGQDVKGCPTRRQVTKKRPVNDNEPKTTKRNCRTRSNLRQGNEPSHGEIKGDSRNEIEDHQTRRSAIKRRRSKKKCHCSPSTPELDVPKHPNISEPSVVMIDCQKTSSKEPLSLASKYPDVRQPKIVLIDCLKRSETTKNKEYELPKSASENNKHRRLRDCDLSTANRHPTRRRSEELKTKFHLPTWRQLSKQQQGSSSKDPNLSNGFECSHQSRGASVVPPPKNSISPYRFGEKRNISSDKPTILPTWRQLTKLQSDSLTHPNTQSGSSCRKTSTTNGESNSKRKRRHSEGSYNWKRSLQHSSSDSDLKCQSNSSASKHGPTSNRENCSISEASKFRRETQETQVVPPTWRQLSILQSDDSQQSQIQVKSRERKPKVSPSAGDGDSKDSTSEKQDMIDKVYYFKAKPITLTTANLNMPTIQISRADSNNTSPSFKKPNTSSANPDKHSTSSAIKELVIPKTKNPTASANSKVRNALKSSPQSRMVGNHVKIQDIGEETVSSKTSAANPDQHSTSSFSAMKELVIPKTKNPTASANSKVRNAPKSSPQSRMVGNHVKIQDIGEETVSSKTSAANPDQHSTSSCSAMKELVIPKTNKPTASANFKVPNAPKSSPQSRTVGNHVKIHNTGEETVSSKTSAANHDQHSTSSCSAMKELVIPKTKKPTVSANFKVPKAPKSSPQSRTVGNHVKIHNTGEETVSSKTSAANPDQHSTSSCSAMKELVIPKTKKPTASANFKVPNAPKSSPQSRTVGNQVKIQNTGEETVSSKTSAANPDQHSTSSCSAMKELVIPKTKKPTASANFKVPNAPKSSPQSRTVGNQVKIQNTGEETVSSKTSAANPDQHSTSSCSAMKEILTPKTKNPTESANFKVPNAPKSSPQSRTIWNQNVKIHDTGGKPYACDECDYRTKTIQLLRAHNLTHAGQRPYPCGLCDQRCRTTTHLKIHRILRHNEKPLACDECDFKGADEVLLQRHTRRTHSRDP